MNEPQQTAPNQSQSQPRRSRWVLITTSIVGGVLLLGVIAFAAVGGILRSLQADHTSAQSMTAETNGIDSLDIDAAASRFSVVYDSKGGESTALLEVQGGSGRSWNLQRDGSDLRVSSSTPFGFGWLGFGSIDLQTVVLHLPTSMRSQQLDADLSLSAGSLQIDADFDELTTEVSAGEMNVDGSANALSVEVSAGSLLFDLDDVSDAEFDVSAGRAKGELNGTAPRSTDISVSAGSVDLVLPDVEYRVDSEVSAGRLKNLVRTDPNSRNVISVEVSAGEVVLQAGR